MIPLIWLIAGVLLVTAEVLSGDFVLLMFGGAALAAAAASALGAPLGADVAVFAVAAVALVLLARPAIHRRLHAGTGVNTGTAALLGAHAEVLETVDVEGGTVKIGGAVWSAKPLHDDIVLAAGSPVVVVGISGATATVSAVQET